MTFFPLGFHLRSSRVRAIHLPRLKRKKETDRSLPFSVENSLFFVLTVDILFILKIHMGLWVLRIALKAVRSKSPFYGGVET